MKKLIRKTFLLMLVVCMIAGVLASAETHEVSAKKKGSTEQQGNMLSSEEQFGNKYPKLKALADNGSIGLKTQEKSDRETIKLGKYFLPNDFTEDHYGESKTRKNDLVWEILEYSEDGKSALVVSKYILVSKEYDSRDKGVTWENCELRKWLNSDFFNNAFSKNEKKLIKQVTVKTEATKGNSRKKSKKEDIVTEDRIFLLSKEELDKYFIPNADKDKNYDGVQLLSRICRYSGGNSYRWFLRSNTDDGDYVKVVSHYGDFDESSFWEDEGVRPAFWVDLTPELIKNNNLSIGSTSRYVDSDVYVTFGNHDNSRLEWLVGDYDETENRALLVCKNLVHYMAFKPGYENDNSWKDSDIRSWLNEDFYKNSFSEDEAARIKNTVTNDVGQKNTKDKVFLLSVSEVENYLTEARYRYGVYPDGAVGLYWLRTPVEESDMMVYYVDKDGLFNSAQHISGFGVRPAIYIDLNPDLNAENYVPEAPEISAEATADGTGMIITTEKLIDAAGFEIFLKGPDSSEFENVDTIARDGSVSRSCIIRHLTPGEYVIKVRAYMENGDRKVYSAFCTEKKLVLEGFTETEYLKENYPKLQELANRNLIGFVSENVRDTVKLGNWDEKDIEWEVLEYSEDGKSALIMSKNILCYRQFNDVDADITWQDSSLRKWLNDDFIKNAFSKSEKKLIKTTMITNEGNIYYETDGGEDTKDKVFLLSASEYEKYIEDTKENGYIDSSTGFDLNGRNGSFWLRTPGRKGSDKNFDGWDEEDWEDYEEEDYLYGYTAFVYDDGELFWEGTGVAYASLGVRPVMWIKLSNKIKRDNNLSLGKYKNITKLYVTFGMEVNGESHNPLEWEVLDYDEKNNKVLLLSRYLIEEKPYYYMNPVTDKRVTWAESTIRKWLNNDFYKAVFSEEEMALIKKVKIVNKDNEESKTKGGKNTKDKIFLLSRSEVQKYFDPESLDSDSQARICRYKNGEPGEWWLRSPGIGKAGKKSSAASYVDTTGCVYSNFAITNYVGIRPAVWITLS